MTLQEVVDKYLTEGYKFFKYTDKDGNELRVEFDFATHSAYLQDYLNYYKEMPSLSVLLENATQGIIKLTKNNNIYYVRHPHQEEFVDHLGNKRGISREISEKVRINLIRRIEELNRCENFEEVINIVTQCREKGFGELSIYDTAVRIAAFLGIEPDRVYLHAGAREGMEALENKGYLPEGSTKAKSIPMSIMPQEMRCMSALEIEHFGCYAKSDIKNYVDIKKDIFKQ